jgi:phospholipid/cholesterol/gamma-HCH transport system permease protein
VRSTLPYDPRRAATLETGWIGALGGHVLGALRTLGALLHTLHEALTSAGAPGSAAAAAVRHITLTQVLFTGVNAVSLVSVVGLLMGTTIIIQASLLAPGAGGEVLGRILVAVVIRELAPLLTAIIVAGRSGTAIATELGNMKVNAEIDALASLGIDVARYVVYPRVIATVISVLVLTVYFAAIAVGGGYVVSLLVASPTFGSLRSGFSAALVPFDLPLFLTKGTGLGLIVGWFSCHFGLQVGSSPTEVPMQASRAVVMTLVACVAYSTVVTVLFYWAVGVPTTPVQQF